MNNGLLRRLRLTAKGESVSEDDMYKMETDTHLEDVKNLYNKLIPIEDIEEEFGIPLTTVFKALNQFFSKEHNCYLARPISLFKTVEGEWELEWMGCYFKLKDYRITWALTREELQ